jgi:excisionase family DNA binding protein
MMPDSHSPRLSPRGRSDPAAELPPQPDLVDELDGAFTPADVKRRCRVSLPTVTRWLLDGRLRSLKVGHKRLVPRAALNEFLRGSQANTEPANGSG